MKQYQYVIAAGALGYLSLPSLVAHAYVERGYFAIGGEWFVPILIMLAAYTFFECKDAVIDTILVIYAAAWLYIAEPIMRFFKKKAVNFAQFVLKSVDK